MEKPFPMRSKESCHSSLDTSENSVRSDIDSKESGKRTKGVGIIDPRHVMKQSSLDAFCSSSIQDVSHNQRERNKSPKMKLCLSDLIGGLNTLKLDETELVLKSPMRIQDDHHSAKPYGNRKIATSRYFGGITRVADSGRNDEQRSLPRSPNAIGSPLPSENSNSLIDEKDVSSWLNMCNKNPKVLEDFIDGCIRELNEGETPARAPDGTSVCSNSSSQITSPARSPPGPIPTSLECVRFGDVSSHRPNSRNVPLPETARTSDPTEKCLKIDRSSAEEDRDRDLPSNFEHPCNRGNVAVALSETARGYVSSPESGIASPNIGTVMLHLASGQLSDAYENTVDLNKFRKTWDDDGDYSYEAVEKKCVNDSLDPKEKEKAWVQINGFDIDKLGKGDADGDTQLIIFLVSKEFNLEYLYVIVERFVKENPEYLSSRNDQNQDALYMAAMTPKLQPIVAAYVAEALIRGKQDVNKVGHLIAGNFGLKYYDGNTLLHCLAMNGDSRAEVLERLLRLKNPDGTSAFDPNKKNNRGYTPLHIACKVHSPPNVTSYETVRLLLEYGADCGEKEYIDENTPLHTLINGSCDTVLLRIMLENAHRFRNAVSILPTTIPNRRGNTALHLACMRNSLEISKQKEAIEILLFHGAMIQMKNINGCVPSVLVDSKRKQEIKSSLHSHRQK